MIKKITVMSLSIILCAFSVSVVLKCAIGVGAWDAFSQTASGILRMKVGTFSMFMNISCVIAQIIIKKQFKIALAMQIILSIILGVLINYFYYQVLANMIFNSYIITLLVFLLANIACAFAVGTVTAQNIISFPLEGLCMTLAIKTGKPFGKIRQLADIITMSFVVLLVLLLDGKMTIREGTVIGMFIFGPLLDIYMRHIKPWMIDRRVFED